jgi:HPr kinase/phosphorylase
VSLDAEMLHATSVAFDGKGLLILGPSGAGKSSLALQMIGLGAVLIADDQTEVFLQDGDPYLRCPATTKGIIEARQVGLLRAPTCDAARLQLVVDLTRAETDRLPERHGIMILGHRVDLVFAAIHAHFPVALMLQLRHGRHA